MNQKPILVFAFITGFLALTYWIVFQLTPDLHMDTTPIASTPEGGGRDFPIYWTAWQLHCSGKPLYSLETTQMLRSDQITQAEVLHNPPWSLWLVAPVAWLPYPLALTAWRILNFLCIPVMVFLSLKLFRKQPPRPILVFFLCVFAPTFACWYYGQLTLLLTVITYLMLLSFQRKWDWIVGICLALMTAKPHIYYLLAFVVGLMAICQWRWRIFAGLAIMALIIASPFLFYGSTISHWLEWVQAGHAAAWKTTTLSTWIRICLIDSSGYIPQWPLYTIPALSLLGCSVWFFFQRSRSLDLAYTSIPLIACSLLTAPYAWSYDFCLLLGWHVLMITPANQRFPIFPVIAAGSTFVFFFQTAWLNGDMHWLIWFPVVTLISTYFWNRRTTPQIPRY